MKEFEGPIKQLSVVSRISSLLNLFMNCVLMGEHMSMNWRMMLDIIEKKIMQFKGSAELP